MLIVRVALILLIACTAVPARAANAEAARTVDVYVFWRAGCPHCERELEFLDRLSRERPNVHVHRLEVLRSKAVDDLMIAVGSVLRADVSSVPFTVIGDRVFIGYLDDASTGRAIVARAEECTNQVCPDTVRGLLAATDQRARVTLDSAMPTARGPPPGTGIPATITVPGIGPVATSTLSLPLLTVILGALDGFNPCAMWILVFLIGLLAGMKGRRRMWLLGGTFVATSAFVYILFLAAWLNLLLFLGALLWVRIGIGIVALAGGGYYLREFVLNREAVCEVTAPERRRTVFARLADLSKREQLLAAMGGIALLAFAVNLVELLCSAGIPAVFTGILAMNALPLWQYYAYLVLYIGVFMLDDLIVLGIALKTLEVIGATSRYARYSNLIGGIALVVIGALLILRPEWLAFS